MAAAKKELLKAIMGGGKGPGAGAAPARSGPAPSPLDGALLEEEDPAAAEDDETIFQTTLESFFPGMTEDEYLQFHRVANAKIGV